MRWDTSKAHNMHRDRAEQKTARTAHMPVFVVSFSPLMPQPHVGTSLSLYDMASSSLSTCITQRESVLFIGTPSHNTQTTADSRLDATRIPAHGAAAEAKRTQAHGAAAVQHGGPCYAGTSATCTSGTLTTLPCSVSGVQRGMRRSCVQDPGSHHGGGQVRHTVGPVTRCSTRHVCVSSSQPPVNAVNAQSVFMGPNQTGAFRASSSAARRQADSSARRCTARGPRGRRGVCVSSTEGPVTRAPAQRAPAAPSKHFRAV